MKRRERRESAEDEARPEEREEGAESPAASATEGELDAALRERDEYLTSWRRATADYQNLRRRMQSDLEGALARHKAGILGDLLLVLDYLDMALATPVTTDEAKNLHAGVEATRTALLSVLEREGVRPLPQPETFDPAVHECVARESAGDAEPGTVLATVRSGYTLDGRILRPAQVRVAGEPAGG